MALKLALPLESTEGEKRVALDPSTVARLRDHYNVNVVIQAGCGHGAGSTTTTMKTPQSPQSFAECVAEAIVVVKIKPPTVEEAEYLPVGSVLLSTITPYLHLDIIEVLRRKQITTFAMDHMPRITRAQPMDVLSSQATVQAIRLPY